jgi:peptidoglycan hydrolase CwlO-like protein
MANRTLIAVGTLCIIAIAISSVNSYLIFTDSEQNTQIDLNETKRKIDSIESSLSSLSEQLTTVLDNSESLNTLNQTIL